MDVNMMGMLEAYRSRALGLNPLDGGFDAMQQILCSSKRLVIVYAKLAQEFLCLQDEGARPRRATCRSSIQSSSRTLRSRLVGCLMVQFSPFRRIGIHRDACGTGISVAGENSKSCLPS